MPFLVVCGLLCLCVLTVLDILIRLRLKDAGERQVFLRGGTLDYAKYLELRKQHHWSALPVYLIPVLLLAGIGLVAVSTDAHLMSQIAVMVVHDPMPAIGFALLGAGGTQVYRLYRKMLGVGIDTSNLLLSIPNAALFTIPRAYLKARSQHGWSAWPAFAVWACVASGLVLLAAGLARFGR